jgi:hypothetical protein
MNSSKILIENGQLVLEKDKIKTSPNSNHTTMTEHDLIIKNKNKLHKLKKYGVDYRIYSPEMLKLLLDGDYYHELLNYEEELKQFLQDVINKKVSLYALGNQTRFFKLAMQYKKNKNIDLGKPRDKNNFHKHKKEPVVKKEPQEPQQETEDETEEEEEGFEVRPQLVPIVEQIQLNLRNGNIKGAVTLLERIPKHYPEYVHIYNNLLSY